MIGTTSPVAESHQVRSATSPAELRTAPRPTAGSHSASRLGAWLRPLTGGVIDVRLPQGDTLKLGEPAEDGLRASVTIHQPRLLRRLALDGSLGAAEGYLDGEWTADDLVNLLRIFCRNLDAVDARPGWVTWGRGVWERLRHRRSSNTLTGSRRNIAAHYDLGNEFFQTFLDSSLMYSSALFVEGTESLEAASVAKLDRVCRQLHLDERDHLLEIGTGWGGLAIHAARNYGCRVTTTTISREQHAFAQQRIADAGLADRITLLREDYRRLTGRFDKLVSIEMIEAVGHEYLPVFFSKCDELLRPGGRMLVQAITMPDQRYERYRRAVDFIQKYIFPGGCLPSIGALQAAASAGTRLQFAAGRQFPDSYALTLREWRRRFHNRLDDIRSLGCDERFLRMWDYYFCYCEAAFLERAVSVGQFQWEKTRY